GGGTIPNGLVIGQLFPRNSNGVLGQPTARLLTSIDNPNQPGNVQDSEGFETGTWNSWAGLPLFAVPGSGSASLGIDATAALVGRLGAHFKVTGDSTASSITSASATRYMPALSATGLQSLAYKIYPKSWGSWGTASSPVSNPAAAPAVAASGNISAPSAPTIGYNGAFVGPHAGF